MDSTITTTFYFAVLFVLQFFTGYILSLLNQILPLNLVNQIIFMQFINLIIPTVFYFILTKNNVKSTLKINRVKIKTVLLTIILCIFIQPSMSLLSAITTLIRPNAAAGLALAIKDANLILALLAIGVTPAICEEIAFRGVILSGYKKLGAKKTIILNGILFSILHLNIQQSLYTFALGVLFAYLVYISQSLITTITAHLIINSTQLLFVWFMMKNGDINVSEQITPTELLALLIFSLITLPIVILLIRAIKRQSTILSQTGR